MKRKPGDRPDASYTRSSGMKNGRRFFWVDLLYALGGGPLYFRSHIALPLLPPRWMQ